MSSVGTILLFKRTIAFPEVLVILSLTLTDIMSLEVIKTKCNHNTEHKFGEHQPKLFFSLFYFLHICSVNCITHCSLYCHSTVLGQAFLLAKSLIKVPGGNGIPDITVTQRKTAVQYSYTSLLRKVHWLG